MLAKPVRQNNPKAASRKLLVRVPATYFNSRCYSSSLVISNVICPKWSAKKFLQGIISSFPFLYFLLHTSSSSCCRRGWQVRPLMVNFRIYSANFFWRCLVKTENENTTHHYFPSADRQDTSYYGEKRMISILFAHIAQCVPTNR